MIWSVISLLSNDSHTRFQELILAPFVRLGLFVSFLGVCASFGTWFFICRVINVNIHIVILHDDYSLIETAVAWQSSVSVDFLGCFKWSSHLDSPGLTHQFDIFWELWLHFRSWRLKFPLETSQVLRGKIEPYLR